jgi:uncharacterized membrane protein HdeD (DUF308 family)
MEFIIDALSGVLSYVISIFNSISGFFSALKTLIINILSKFLTLVVDILLFIPRQIYSYLTDLAEYILSFFANFTIYQNILNGLNSLKSLSNFGSCFSYIFDILSLNAGFQLLIFAYLLRFAIRRLPVVG